MVLTISDFGGAGKHLIIKAKDKRFIERYGTALRTTAENFYLASVEISRWCNNELKEECLFEID